MRQQIRNIALLALMLLSAALGAALRPTIGLADQRKPIDLQRMVPSAFGVWREETNLPVQVVNPQQKQTLEKIYSQTLSRIYINRDGYRIMLSIAYGKNQSDSLELHKPEVCYPAQGFALMNVKTGSIVSERRVIYVTRLVTALERRIEPITYWTTVSDTVVQGSIEKKLAEIKFSVAGEIPDGLLFRVSSIDSDVPGAFLNQEKFIKEILHATMAVDLDRLAGKVQ